MSRPRVVDSGMRVGWIRMGVRDVLDGMLLVAVLTGGAAAGAAGPVTTGSGVYSAAQALDGERVFLDRCAGCHQPDLSGGEDAPALAGAQFAARWDGRTLADLFTVIDRSMPQDAPGSLDPAAAAALIAHILDRNGFPKGSAPLSSDLPSLAAVTFVAE